MLHRNGLLAIFTPLLFLAASFWLSRRDSMRDLRSSSIASVRTMTIYEVQKGLNDGAFTSYDLIKTYLARIKEVNSEVNVVTEVNGDALALAASLDRERKISGKRSELHGIPLLVKNTISVADMGNTAGSFALFGATTKHEASVITKLREAGAILLGKANLSQWGNNRSSNSSNGWSAHGGQVLGVYCSNQDPWGSSSGSAVGVTLGLCTAALGTEVEGSIVGPAERSNVVAIKPTVGLVSRDNVLVSTRQGTVGPIANSVKDAALILSIMAGSFDEDPATSKIPFQEIPKYENSCNSTILPKVRLGIPRNGFKGNSVVSVTPYVLARFEKAVKVLESIGAIVVDNADYPAYDEMLRTEPQRKVSPVQFLVDTSSYLEGLDKNPNGITSLEDTRSFTQSHPKEEYPDRNTKLWDIALGHPDYVSLEFQENVRKMEYFGGPGGVAGAMEAAKVDALVMPTSISPIVAALAGYPIVTIPLGFAPDNTSIKMNKRGNLVEIGPAVPFGISFVGLPWTEELLIHCAHALEQAMGPREEPVPVILPETELFDVVRQYFRAPL